MKNENYPSLYQAANMASVSAQNNYLKIVATDLIFMIVGASLAVYNYSSSDSKLVLYCISGLFLLTSLIMSIVLKSKAFEDVWYQGRALAESVKTLTWRYLICSELFESNLDIVTVNKLFTDRLRDLAGEFKELNKAMDSRIALLPLITNEMVATRSLTMAERKKYYIENRIRDQMVWYSNKAEFNKIRYNRWFVVIIAGQFFSLVSVVLLIKDPLLNWNLVGFFTTISASAISWLQLKQHQELKQAYTTAAQELAFIETASDAIANENELSRFVLDSENAISREHTLWLAQKRK